MLNSVAVLRYAHVCAVWSEDLACNRAGAEPKAARAVARACAQNRLAVIVPCHRIIRGDGSLGGYRWGLPRKAALLQAESKPQRHVG